MEHEPDVTVTQENGAATHVTAYVSELDGAVVVEVDTDGEHETDVRVNVNDSLAWEGRV